MTQRNYNEWRPEVTLRITAAAVIGLAALVLVAVFIVFREYREEVRFVANVLSWSGGIYAAYHAGISLRLNLYRDRQKRAYEILDSFNKVDSASVRSMIDSALAGSAQPTLAYQAMKSDKDKDGAIRYVLGILEDMSIAIRTGYADENILFASLCGTTLRYYDAFKTYIDELRRDRNNPKIYIELERLAGAWRTNRSLANNRAVLSD